MNIRSTIFLVAILVCGVGLSFSQTMSKGYLKMELIDVKVSSPEMEQMVGAMKGSTQEIYFDQNKQKVVVDMMGGLMKIQMYQDFGDNVTENYMDMMGQKIKTVMSAEELAAQEKQSEELMGDSKVVYDKNDTKEILGYNCHKASLSMEAEGKTIKMDFYVTDQINVPKTFVQNMNHLDLQGTPLEFTMDMDVMSMTYTAREIKQEVPADFFAKPTGEYRTMTIEELQQMGMGGQLGF